MSDDSDSSPRHEDDRFPTPDPPELLPYFDKYEPWRWVAARAQSVEFPPSFADIPQEVVESLRIEDSPIVMVKVITFKAREGPDDGSPDAVDDGELREAFYKNAFFEPYPDGRFVYICPADPETKTIKVWLNTQQGGDVPEELHEFFFFGPLGASAARRSGRS